MEYVGILLCMLLGNSLVHLLKGDYNMEILLASIGAVMRILGCRIPQQKSSAIVLTEGPITRISELSHGNT